MFHPFKGFEANTFHVVDTIHFYNNCWLINHNARQHSRSMRTVHLPTVRAGGSTHPDPFQPHMPLVQPCMPPSATHAPSHAHPPTTHAPKHAHTPDHAHPQTTPLTTHAPQPCIPLGPRMLPCGQNDRRL